MEPKGVVGASCPRWIPVTERLPEIYEDVIVFTKQLGTDMDYRTHDGHNHGFSYEVTHWMPLPPPPVEGGTQHD